MDFLRSIRNAIIIGTSHAITVGLISKILYPIGFFATSLGFNLLLGAWNLHWLLGLGLTGFLTAGAWFGADYILSHLADTEFAKTLKKMLPDNVLFYGVVGLGFPLTIAFVSPLLGALSALFLGPLALPHIPGFPLNVRKEEGADSVLQVQLVKNQSRLEEMARPYLAPHSDLQLLVDGPVIEVDADPNDPELSEFSDYESEDDEDLDNENTSEIPQILGDMAIDASQAMTVRRHPVSVLKTVPFFGRFFNEQSIERTIKPIGTPTRVDEIGGHNLRGRLQKQA